MYHNLHLRMLELETIYLNFIKDAMIGVFLFVKDKNKGI